VFFEVLTTLSEVQVAVAEVDSGQVDALNIYMRPAGL
jgi:hypothetical protein